MKCPICKDHKHVEIDTHSDGFADNLQECGTCGALWTRNGEKVIILQGCSRPQAVNL